MNALPHHRRRKPSGTIQITTWNVDGLQQCAAASRGNGFRLYVEAERPTILVITEVNQWNARSFFETDPTFAFLLAMYPHRYWAGKVAVFSQVKPMSEPVLGFPQGTEYDKKEGRARIMSLDFPGCFLLATYVQYSGKRLINLPKRMAWAADFEPYIRSLDAQKPVIWTGDFNVICTTTPTRTVTNDAELPVELKWARTCKAERDAHERLLGEQPWLDHPRRPQNKFVDVWRVMKGPNAKQYSCHGKMWNKWRLDGFIVTERYLHRIRKCEIRDEVFEVAYGRRGEVWSDHCPVWLNVEGEEL
ncbi:hypothetical protein JCM8547_005791 [Rhodosporidiobolus lusitaniae]